MSSQGTPAVATVEVASAVASTALRARVGEILDKGAPYSACKLGRKADLKDFPAPLLIRSLNELSIDKTKDSNNVAMLEYTNDAPWVYESCHKKAQCAKQCVRVHADSIIMAVHADKCLDGKIRYATHFGLRNPFNSIFELPDDEYNNIALATLDAAIKVLHFFKEMRITAPGFHPFYSAHWNRLPAVNALNHIVDSNRIAARKPYQPYDTKSTTDSHSPSMPKPTKYKDAVRCCKCTCHAAVTCTWCEPQRLIIKTDSAFLMTIVARVAAWMQSGFSREGLSPTYLLVYQSLSEMMYEFWHNKVDLVFWQVKPDKNPHAVGMIVMETMLHSNLIGEAGAAKPGEQGRQKPGEIGEHGDLEANMQDKRHEKKVDTS